MKTLWWFDDDFNQMFPIVRGTITKLWGLKCEGFPKIRSKIAIFGNAFLERDEVEFRSSLEQKRACNEIMDEFIDRCMDLDGPSRERKTFHENKELATEAVLFLLKKDSPEDREIFENVKRAYAGETEDEAAEQSGREGVLKLIERMDLDEESVVGIDISLLHGDIQRVKAGERVLSMELFYQFRQQNIKTFLYSSEAGINDFSEKWEETYRSVYDGEERNIHIFERKDLLKKGDRHIDQTIINDFFS